MLYQMYQQSGCTRKKNEYQLNKMLSEQNQQTSEYEKWRECKSKELNATPQKVNRRVGKIEAAALCIGFSGVKTSA